MNTTDLIQGFIEANRISGHAFESNEPINEPYPYTGKRFQVILFRPNVQTEIFWLPAGKLTEEMSLEEALWFISDEADNYSGMGEYDRWIKENEEHLHELGEETMRVIHAYQKDIGQALERLLGLELMQDLNYLIRNGAPAPKE